MQYHTQHNIAGLKGADFFAKFQRVILRNDLLPTTPLAFVPSVIFLRKLGCREVVIHRYTVLRGAVGIFYSHPNVFYKLGPLFAIDYVT